MGRNAQIRRQNKRANRAKRSAGRPGRNPATMGGPQPDLPPELIPIQEAQMGSQLARQYRDICLERVNALTTMDAHLAQEGPVVDYDEDDLGPLHRGVKGELEDARGQLGLAQLNFCEALERLCAIADPTALVISAPPEEVPEDAPEPTEPTEPTDEDPA